MLEWSILSQFFDLMTSSSHDEVVKLIVACLDYSLGESALPLVVLQKALTSTNEISRKWCTRFIGALAALRLPGFGQWGIKLLLAQLGDSSVKVVRQATKMLHTWLPRYPEQVVLLRSVQFDAFGNAGTLLKVHMFTNEKLCQTCETLIREQIEFWMETFNTRYFNTIDDEMRECLLSIGRSMDGSFTRASRDRNKATPLPTPLHLFAALSSHALGRKLLTEANVIGRLMAQLSEKEKSEKKEKSIDIDKFKGTILAICNIGSCDDGLQMLPLETIPKIIKLAEESEILSVRGIAFWGLNIVGLSAGGARCLCKLGWESNQHRWVVDEVRRIELTHEDNRKRTISNLLPEIKIPANDTKRNRCQSSPTFPVAVKRSASDASNSPMRELSEEQRSKSDQYLSMIDVTEQESISTFRTDRALTTESVITGSFAATSVGSRRVTTTGSPSTDMESRTRSWTISRCIRDGLDVDKEGLLEKGTAADLLRDPHFSSRNRERWRLAPLRIRRCLQVNRNVGDPVRYIFMTKDEEERVSKYRLHMLNEDNLWRRLHSDPRADIHGVHAAHSLALPAEAQVMCTKIFPSRQNETETSVNFDGESRYGTMRRDRIDAARPHSTWRCFYCEAKKEKYILPADNATVASLRRQVLHEVDMLEVKETTPEKKLIDLWMSHRWLFAWPCLYSDVLELLDEIRFKPQSRSFLQQIFYDALQL